MDIEAIKALAAILVQNNLTTLEVWDGETKIKLGKNGPANEAITPKANDIPAPGASLAQLAADQQAVDFNKLIEVKSPIVGIFYSAATPDADPFVTIGSKVKKGDTLCLIEAMKLMNEITADTDGEIVDICIKNGDIAEYGQVLFKIF
jgi:acetyl-CoA carboxylase biotin carboxyl carrier protein